MLKQSFHVLSIALFVYCILEDHVDTKLHRYLPIKYVYPSIFGLLPHYSMLVQCVYHSVALTPFLSPQIVHTVATASNTIAVASSTLYILTKTALVTDLILGDYIHRLGGASMFIVCLYPLLSVVLDSCLYNHDPGRRSNRALKVVLAILVLHLLGVHYIQQAVDKTPYPILDEMPPFLRNLLFAPFIILVYLSFMLVVCIHKTAWQAFMSVDEQ